MRHLLPLVALLAACGTDPTATPDPTEASNAASGVGGSSSVDASASATDAAASQSAAEATASASATSSDASSAEATTGVGGEGGAPPVTASSASTGAGGDGGASTQGGGYTDGSRIKPRYLVASDGLVAPQLDFFDTRLGEPCYWYATSASTKHCLPSGGGVATSFADAQCTQRVGYFNACAGASGMYALTYEIDDSQPACSQYFYLAYQRGAAVPSGSPLYIVNASGNCVTSGVANASTYITTPAPLSSFVSAEVVVGEP